jgi:hypothetical protein
MKSKIIESNSSESTSYPCLKKHKVVSGLVVLFNARRAGMVVNEAKNGMHKLGEYDNIWLENNFEPFAGRIELSN